MGKSIFIVEDDPDIVELYELLLSEAGYRVLPPVRQGADAGEIYGRLPIKPDILLLDYGLPGKNGLQVAVEIRERDPEVPILVCSAYPSVFQKFAALGRCVCIAKPFASDDLLLALELAMAGRHTGEVRSTRSSGEGSNPAFSRSTPGILGA